MRREKRSSNKHREITVEIDILTALSVALIILMGVLLLFSFVDFFGDFLGVKYFEIEGECPYTEGELAVGAGINKGDKLYRLDKSKAEKEIIANCPYVEKVNIKTSFPNKIRFVVECYEPIWYVEISGDYYVLDEELCVLEETKNKERLYEWGVTSLTLPNVKRAVVGEKIVFGGSEVETEATLKIIETVLASPIRDMMSGVDIDNRYDIHFELDSLTGEDKLEGRFFVSVGGYSRLDAKLDYIARALEKENLEGVSGGTIDVSENGEKVSIRPEYTSNATEESTEENTEKNIEENTYDIYAPVG